MTSSFHTVDDLTDIKTRPKSIKSKDERVSIVHLLIDQYTEYLAAEADRHGNGAGDEERPDGPEGEYEAHDAIGKMWRDVDYGVVVLGDSLLLDGLCVLSVDLSLSFFVHGFAVHIDLRGNPHIAGNGDIICGRDAAVGSVEGLFVICELDASIAPREEAPLLGRELLLWMTFAEHVRAQTELSTEEFPDVDRMPTDELLRAEVLHGVRQNRL